MIIRFRPHHFLCLLSFQGKGYSPSFIQNFDTIKKQLEAAPNQSIEIVTGLDSICQACPERTTKGACKKEKKVSSLDQAHQDILKLKQVKKSAGKRHYTPSKMR